MTSAITVLGTIACAIVVAVGTADSAVIAFAQAPAETAPDTAAPGLPGTRDAQGLPLRDGSAIAAVLMALGAARPTPRRRSDIQAAVQHG